MRGMWRGGRVDVADVRTKEGTRPSHFKYATNLRAQSTVKIAYCDSFDIQLLTP